MQYLRVVGWGKFQHYTDRSPPWIKLHNSILEHYEFTRLPDASKAHLMAIWLLASRSDNRIPADPKWIQARIGAKSAINLAQLVRSGFLEEIQSLPSSEQDASNVLAKCYREGEGEGEGEGEREREGEQSRKRGARPSVAQVREYVEANGHKVDPGAFCDYYQAQGWKLANGRPMNDWQAAVRNWARRDKAGAVRHTGNGQQRLRKPTTDSEWIELAKQYRVYDRSLGYDALWRRICNAHDARKSSN